MTDEPAPAETAPSSDNIRRRIEARIGQGEFIAGLLRVAGRESSTVQSSFVDRLSHIAGMMRELLEQNGLIRRLIYRPREFWPQQRGRSIAFIDGGVANIDLPSAAPLGIRVGSYIVRPGDETLDREQFNIEALPGIEWVILGDHRAGSMQVRTLRRRYSSLRNP